MVNKSNPPLVDRIILGIDPGTNVMGYGLISVKGNQLTLIQFGVVHLSKYADHALKLSKIFERISHIIDEYHPDEMAIEAPFFGTNVQSMLKLGRAQGVAIAAAISKQVPILPYDAPFADPEFDVAPPLCRCERLSGSAVFWL